MHSIRSDKEWSIETDPGRSLKVQPEKIRVQPSKDVPATLLAEYLDRCLTTLPAVKEAMDRSDHGQTQVFGHRLKGTGAAYGVPLLTEIGSRIEGASSRGETEELRRQVAALEAYLSRIEIVSQ